MDTKKTPDATPTRVPRELQQMWLSLARSSWSSIVIVPTAPGLPAGATAQALVEMAPFYNLGSFELIDATGASLSEGSRIARELAAHAEAGRRVVVAVDSPMHNPGAVPVMLAADAALLLVALGASEIEWSRSVIEIVGRERVLGCIAVEG